MYPLSKGKVAWQAHVGLPDGTYEEEHGREAFDGRASHLYRTHFPTAWVRIYGPVQPRAYDLNGLKPPDLTDAAAGWQRILHNDDLAVFVSRRTEAPPWYLRDADGDLCYFVHQGAGTLETDYGPLHYRDGDFLVLPKGTTHRVVPDGAGETFLYAVEVIFPNWHSAQAASFTGMLLHRRAQPFDVELDYVPFPAGTGCRTSLSPPQLCSPADPIAVRRGSSWV